MGESKRRRSSNRAWGANAQESHCKTFPTNRSSSPSSSASKRSCLHAPLRPRPRVCRIQRPWGRGTMSLLRSGSFIRRTAGTATRRLAPAPDAGPGVTSVTRGNDRTAQTLLAPERSRCKETPPNASHFRVHRTGPEIQRARDGGVLGRSRGLGVRHGARSCGLRTHDPRSRRVCARSLTRPKSRRPQI